MPSQFRFGEHIVNCQLDPRASSASDGNAACGSAAALVASCCGIGWAGSRMCLVFLLQFSGLDLMYSTDVSSRAFVSILGYRLHSPGLCILRMRQFHRLRFLRKIRSVARH